MSKSFLKLLFRFLTVISHCKYLRHYKIRYCDSMVPILIGLSAFVASVPLVTKNYP